MKGLGARSNGLACIVALVFATSAVAGISFHKGTIEKIVDGDTLWVLSNKSTTSPEPSNAPAPANRLKIRMLGMDTPETHLPTIDQGIVGQGVWGETATKKMAALAPLGTKVTIEDQGFDKYGRTLGRIFIGDQDVNLAMVTSGWAIPYLICAGELCDEGYFERDHVQEYVTACESAEKRGVGIFNPKNPLKELPFEFRLRMQNRKPDKYVGDFYSGDLYSPQDYKEVPTCSRIFFMTKQDAVNAGYEFRH